MKMNMNMHKIESIMFRNVVKKYALKIRIVNVVTFIHVDF